MVYLSVITGLVTALSWGTTDYMSRAHSERIGYYKAIIYSMLVTLIVRVPVTPLVSPHLVALVLPLLALIIAGFLNFIGFTFLYRAFHTGVVSLVAPVAYTYPTVTTVLSIVVLKTFPFDSANRRDSRNGRDKVSDLRRRNEPYVRP